MKPRVVFPDAMLAVVQILRTRLTSLPGSAHATGATVGTRVPVDKSVDKTYVPYVLVRLDGSVLTRQVDEEATIRVSIWHESEAKGIALAQACRAILLSYEGGSEVRVATPLTGVIPTSDPESGEPLSTFTVAVRLRPQTL